jgi:hypothetical protein
MRPEDKIREVSPLWRWGGRGPITDPIDMEFRLGEEAQNQITVLRLETAASIYRALSDGFAKGAQIVGSQRSE